MACTTCSHTMQGLGYGNFWCPRCGTVQGPELGYSVPALVGRCRRFSVMFPGYPDNRFRDEWHRLGINESINRPESRPT